MSRQIDVSTLRRQLSSILRHVSSEGPVDVLCNGRVIATIGRPPKQVRAKKPVVNPRRLARLCQKHHIKRLALFGSILRDDFGPDSDVDVLVDPERGHLKTLTALSHARAALVDLFGRPVDMLNRSVVEKSQNPFRKQSILEGSKVIYEARS